MTDSERKHNPTPRHRKKAREQGRYARSEDLASAIMLLVAMSILWFTGPNMFAELLSLLSQALEGRLVAKAELVGSFQGLLVNGLMLVLPMLASVFIAAVIYQWFQSGFQVLPGRVTFDPSRLGWARGVSKLASAGGIPKVGFGLLKIAVLVCIIGSDFFANADKVLMAPSLSTISMTGLLGQLLLVCGFKVAGALIALGLIEYAYQWRQFERSLMMTDEEMRENLKSESANPQLLGRRNQLRQDLRT